MKLYYTPGACSLSPHIVLREAGATCELDKVSLKAKKPHDGKDYLAVNPKGAVPALGLDNGEVLTEVSASGHHIADKAGNTQLAPAAGSAERMRLQEWLNYIASEVHKGFSPLFKDTTPADYIPVVKANLAKQFKYLDAHLGKHDYLLGKSFTAADAYLFTIMNWRNFKNIDIAEFKNLQAYLDRVGARPKVKEAMQAEGLLKAAA
ncbi:MAG: glutathione transferase GstA [Pseudolabrys sp.]